MWGEGGDDSLFGGDGNDGMDGGAGNNILSGTQRTAGDVAGGKPISYDFTGTMVSLGFRF